MPIQILTHTPPYVWAILAFLVWRGLAEMHTRTLAPRRLFILPLVMLALAFQDIVARFGAGAPVVAAWTTGCALAGWATWRLARSRIASAAQPGRIQVRGSRVPLVLMMAIFATRYAAGVALAIQPQLAHQLNVVLAIGALYGVFNGIFLGRLVRDAASLRTMSLAPAGQAAVQPVAATLRQG